jgi:hypothetical protein
MRSVNAGAGLLQSFSSLPGSGSEAAADVQLTSFLAGFLRLSALQLLFNFPIPDTKFQKGWTFGHNHYQTTN